MFIIKDVRVLSCEQKDWTMKGNDGVEKTGVYFPTTIRLGGEIFNVTSKVLLVQDNDYDLEFELQSKTPKVGSAYTGVRIVSIS